MERQLKERNKNTDKDEREWEMECSDIYKYKYIQVYQKWADMNMNTIIWTDIC